eukprot:1544318-Ditylum_brightwellii.AAC.1
MEEVQEEMKVRRTIEDKIDRAIIVEEVQSRAVRTQSSYTDVLKIGMLQPTLRKKQQNMTSHQQEKGKDRP